MLEFPASADKPPPVAATAAGPAPSEAPAVLVDPNCRAAGARPSGDHRVREADGIDFCKTNSDLNIWGVAFDVLEGEGEGEEPPYARVASLVETIMDAIDSWYANNPRRSTAAAEESAAADHGT